MALVDSFRLFLIVLCAVPNRGQQIFFHENDIRTIGNAAIVRVERQGQITDQLNVTIRPMTFSQYQATGGVGCTLDPNVNPAEAEDFDSTPLKAFFYPSANSFGSITFEVSVPEDNIVEPEEVFVIVLEVTGGTPSITRGCTLIHIGEQFSGQFLQWTHNGVVVSSALSMDLQESSGSQVIITAERLVPAEVTTAISVSLQGGGVAVENSDFVLRRYYIIPPERSSVDIVLNIIDDDTTESDETVTLSIIASASGVFLGTERSRRVTVNILDNEALNYMFVNTAPVINVTEGENVTLMSGLNPIVATGTRVFQFARIQLENGSAIEGTDFMKLDDIVMISTDAHSSNVVTIFRPGMQPTRSFTVRLVPYSSFFAIHRETHIQGTMTINILDNGMTPLAPSISTLNFTGKNKDQLNTTWSHEATRSRPVEGFIVIIKSCSKRPCTINPDSLQPDEKAIPVTKDNLKLLRNVDLKNSIFGVVVCAINPLGRNCSSSYEIDWLVGVAIPQPLVTEKSAEDNTFLIWVVILCVALFLLCCLLPCIILILCCCYKRDKERSYFPRKTMGRKLKGQSPASTDSSNADFYLEEVKHSDLKYL